MDIDQSNADNDSLKETLYATQKGLWPQDNLSQYRHRNSAWQVASAGQGDAYGVAHKARKKRKHK